MQVIKEYSGIKVTINEEDINKKGVIYLLEFPNKNVYIGQTQNELFKRLSAHCRPYNGCMKVMAAIQKYKTLQVTVIESECTIQELNYLEQYYIKLFNSFGENGYNLSSGGLNYIVSQETKDKISSSKKGKPNKSARVSFSKKVQSFPDGFIFQSLTDAGEFYDIDHCHMHRYTKGKEHPRSGQTFLLID